MNRDVERNSAESFKSTRAKSTEAQAFFNFFKTVWGIGIIAIPYLSYQVGYIWTIPLIFAVIFCCIQ